MSASSSGRSLGALSASVSSILLVGLGAAAQAQIVPAATGDAVVITANRSPQPLASVLAELTVIDRRTIERSGAVDVADLLARLPGVEFTRNGGPGAPTSVFVRGSESRHTAVYIDGMRIDSQATGGATWEQIPIEQIERIEVLRGPAAAVYGSDAVAGVVQMFTRRGQGAAQPTAALSLGSYGTVRAQAGLSGSVQALDYTLSAAHGQSDGFDARTPAVPHNPDRDGWKRDSVQAGLGFAVAPGHRLEAALLAARLRTQYDGFDLAADDRSEQDLRTGHLAWQGRWSDAASTRVQLGQTLTTYESQPDFYRTETTLRNALLMHEQRFGGHRLTATLERREDELYNPATVFSPPLEGARSQNALGLGWQAEFGAHAWQAHVRRDDDSEFGGQNTGSLAWGWSFAPAWRATASAATSFRAPTLFQRFSAFGNPTLVPETGRNVELGLRWAAGGEQASLSAWRNRVENLIDFGPPGPCADPFGCYVNAGRAELRGVTLAGRTQLAGVVLSAALDWHDPRNLDTGLRLPRRASQLARLGAETQLSGWTLGAELQAAGARYEDAANTVRLGGYGIWSLVAGTTLVPGLTLEGRIDNVGDKAYELAYAYATAGRSAQLALRWTMP